MHDKHNNYSSVTQVFIMLWKYEKFESAQSTDNIQPVLGN